MLNQRPLSLCLFHLLIIGQAQTVQAQVPGGYPYPYPSSPFPAPSCPSTNGVACNLAIDRTEYQESVETRVPPMTVVNVIITSLGPFDQCTFRPAAADKSESPFTVHAPLDASALTLARDSLFSLVGEGPLSLVPTRSTQEPAVPQALTDLEARVGSVVNRNLQVMQARIRAMNDASRLLTFQTTLSSAASRRTDRVGRPADFEANRGRTVDLLRSAVESPTGTADDLADALRDLGAVPDAQVRLRTLRAQVDRLASTQGPLNDAKDRLMEALRFLDPLSNRSANGWVSTISSDFDFEATLSLKGGADESMRGAISCLDSWTAEPVLKRDIEIRYRSIFPLRFSFAPAAMFYRKARVSSFTTDGGTSGLLEQDRTFKVMPAIVTTLHLRPRRPIYYEGDYRIVPLSFGLGIEPDRGKPRFHLFAGPGFRVWDRLVLVGGFDLSKNKLGSNALAGTSPANWPRKWSLQYSFGIAMELGTGLR